ncbi:MAG TPA: metallophosphoesterase [Rhizomicrobium sp.]|nr:metallophosphoesterase [Rhizomicrobium sp.]
MRRFIAAFVFVLLPLAAKAETVSRWVQLGPGGAAQARVLVTDEKCPAIEIDGAQVAMQERAAPDAAFAVRLCSADLPKDAKSVSIMGAALPVPVSAPQRILVLGDTGCRIKGKTVQACNDPAKWPFPALAATAAATKPDLIIHVGDYLYRESACPAGDARCAGSPSGDDWPAWNADFFAPAAPLLAAAPMVFVRGNHEDCPRSGAGFLRLMGPNADAHMPCAHLAPYAVPIGGVTLAVMDDADAPDEVPDLRLVSEYRADFASLAKLGTEPLWITMHRPIWGAVTGPLGLTVGGNATIIASLDKDALKPVSLMLSGHIHAFEVLNYKGNVPPQILAGNSGDNLDPAPTDLSGIDLSGQYVTDGLARNAFGFLLMTRSDKGWNVEVHNADGALAMTCVFANGRVDCPK